jgi:hypothetical protein
MKNYVGVVVGAVALCASASFAQAPVAPVAAQAQAAALVVGGPAAPMLRMGQEISLRTLIELTTLKKGLSVGQRVPLEVAEPIMLNGQTVIPAGTPAMGEITQVRNKGMWGKSGAFSGRVLFLRVGDRQIRMSGTFDDKGHAGGGAAVATSAIVFLPAGFFMTGTSASMKIGAPVKGFLDEDVPVQLAAVPVAPAALQAVAPAVAIPASLPAGIAPAAPAMAGVPATTVPTAKPVVQPALITTSATS